MKPWTTETGAALDALYEVRQFVNLPPYGAEVQPQTLAALEAAEQLHAELVRLTGACGYRWRPDGRCGRIAGHLGVHGDRPATLDRPLGMSAEAVAS